MDRDVQPRRSLFRLPSSLPNLWDEMEDKMNRWMGWEADTGISISEDDSNVYVEAHLPGLKSDEIDISFYQNTVWIKGEKKQEEVYKDRKFYKRSKTSYFYQIDIPTQVEESTEQACFKDGVLTITFKKNPRLQARKIALSDSSEQKTV
ncbi:Hsp20/alpha crystallin family protein [Candidatus Protochlamydia amoebophila]|uniref:Small heat shock protein C4 n=1 Tax=Candidatus Protochlamydia amoebophila TaxID=362787 RepID=A0A0C1JHN8_9BACT|nr:Hsp20/alpha crystallin family protein [Candidatus Protochlamydia amoebophila]KIC70930.1 Small heat shock protein C4 [Candidatus Protochlamydia amoebophila]